MIPVRILGTASVLPGPPVTTAELCARVGRDAAEVERKTGIRTRHFAPAGLRDAPGKDTSTFVAQLDPRTKAAERAPIELVVDTVRMHFFDVDSGLGIYGNGS